MLANRELQHFMNYTWFQNLNYNGLGASPMLLNQYGDFESSYDIFYYTGDNDNLTMFFDGSNIPPPDGPITISYVLVTISNSYALLFTILGSVGIGFSLFIFIFLIQYRKHHLVKSIGVDYTVVSLLGCILGYIHLLLETNPPSSLMCKIQILSLLLTYSFILIPLAVKNLYVWIIFTADEALDIDSLSKKLYGLTGALLFIEIILTAVWYSYSNASLKPFFTHTLEVYDCMYSHQTSIMTEAVQGALYVFNFGILIALISLASMVRNVLPTWNESALLLTIFFLYSLCGGFIYLLPMNTDEFNDLRRCLAVYATVTITLSILALPRVINVLCYNIFTLQNTQNLLKKLRSLEKTGNRLSAVIKTDKEILQHQIWGTSSRHNSRHSLNNQISGLHEAFTLRKTVAVVPIEEESNGSSVNTKQSETQKLLISRSLPGPVKYLYHTMSHRYLFRLKQTELRALLDDCSGHKPKTRFMLTCCLWKYTTHYKPNTSWTTCFSNK
ncbi:hypothetical protein BCR33DRAFT_450888 [Rhizoclosmatium globosum]|uniref:G-protein coupled receptors family 3 profile domain-containing protein n=1 Tax=Rhizoclosmatium globosum TaxID=329046 RepID=A0A1Y2CW58_9FUNG|nr:hypothetical protein BCR33DRAFT_450888 [Rhizoclosmatium globosum]|eukprot:ORY51262.1 hypothetical protein BCR33DRAFT_450888 [Rhizoclosmatium globosum]